MFDMVPISIYLAAVVAMILVMSVFICRLCSSGFKSTKTARVKKRLKKHSKARSIFLDNRLIIFQ